MRTSAIDHVRSALLNGERLTSLDAYHRFGIQHLASTIRYLREQGMAINSRAIIKRNADGRAVRFAAYELAGGDDARA